MRVFVMKKATVFRIAAFVMVFAAILVYAKVMMNEDAAVFSQQGTLTAGSGEEKEVAITIDTSFGEADQTKAILDVLDAHGADATFAVMGVWARENPHMVREILKRGYDVMNHSMTHEKYSELGAEGALADAKANREYLKTEFGADTDLLRLPYGNGTDEVCSALGENGFRIVGWSLDSKDWNGDSAEEIAERIMDKIKAGDILLFQNNTEAAPAALDTVLQKLGERAYETVSVEDMLDTEMRTEG